LLTAFVKNLVDTHTHRPPRSGCPVNGHVAPAQRIASPDTEPVCVPVDPAEAKTFLEQFYAETAPFEPFEKRLREIRQQIAETGSYEHTPQELTFGARVAWRNSARCIGRLYWHGLRVRDRRHLKTPTEVADECVEHLRLTTRGGQIRSTITVFAPDRPGRPGPRIHNEQLIRYAGYSNADGTVHGDPRNAGFTDRVTAMGWRPPTPSGRFDLLPLLISGLGTRPELFEIPRDAVLEVPIRHPDYSWFADLRLRWHAVPAISNMPLIIGGVRYSAAPFNGWYLNTEIGARNLADAERYDMLPAIAEALGLDTSSVRTMWRDRALVELVRAVQYSFDASGVRMADHHTESERFLVHVDNERKAGRTCPTEWSWIVPPLSGALTPVFHQYYDEPDPDARPAFLPPPGASVA
jgi:nitric-oxide synthase